SVGCQHPCARGVRGRGTAGRPPWPGGHPVGRFGDMDERNDTRLSSLAVDERDGSPKSRWPWLLWGLAMLLVLAAITVFVVGGPGTALKPEDVVFLPVILLTILGYSTVGAILASRNTRNPMGWIMLTVGLAFALAQATEAYAKYTLEIDPGVLPFGAVAAWFGT